MKPTYFIESAEPISPWDYERDNKSFKTAKGAVEEAIKSHGSLWKVVRREVVFTSADNDDICSVCGGDLLFDVEQDGLELASSPCTCDDLLDVLKTSRDTLNNAIEADDWDFVDSVVWDIEQAVARVTKEIK